MRKFFFIFIIFFFQYNAFAVEESRIEFLESQTKTFVRTWFGLGLFHDGLVERTKGRYAPEKPGLTLSFDQTVLGNWTGGIWVHWALWRGSKEQISEANTLKNLGQEVKGVPAEEISPLSILSQISYQIPLAKLSPRLGSFVRPYVSGGFGWLQFLKERAFWPERTDVESSEPMITFGVGCLVTIREDIGLRVGFDRWRGVNTNNFVSHRASLALVLGDFGEAPTSW